MARNEIAVSLDVLNLKQVAPLVDIVRRLAALDPTNSDGYGYWCGLCRKGFHEHAPGCVWADAVALIDGRLRSNPKESEEDHECST